MSEQVCIKCGGGPWPPHRFYQSGTKRDGSIRYDKKCKDCRKQQNAEHRMAHADYYRLYDQIRYQRPGVKAQRQQRYRQYMQTKRGKAARRRKTRAWRITHPEAYAAMRQRATAALRAKRAAKRSPPPGVNDGYQDPRSTDAGHCGASHLQDA